MSIGISNIVMKFRSIREERWVGWCKLIIELCQTFSIILTVFSTLLDDPWNRFSVFRCNLNCLDFTDLESYKSHCFNREDELLFLQVSFPSLYLVIWFWNLDKIFIANNFLFYSSFFFFCFILSWGKRNYADKRENRWFLLFEAFWMGSTMLE